jgi:hypothetical protein
MDNILACAGNTLIGSAESSFLADQYARHAKEEWMKHLNNINLVSFLEKLKDDDNPVLVFYHLKN